MPSPSSLADRAASLCERALWSSQARTSEADLRADLFLELGPYVIDELEVPRADVRQEGVGLSGRFDSMFGRSIVEYKRPGLLRSPAEREAAAVQALDYLEDETLGAQVVMITDGEVWAFLRDADAGPEEGEQGWLLFPDPVEPSPVDRFAWHETSEETALRVLELLRTLRTAPVTPISVASRLGLYRDDVVDLLKLLSERLTNRVPDDRTDVLFRQWIQLAGVAYGISEPDEGFPKPPAQMLEDKLAPVLGDLSYPEAIFVLHTYVGLATKLVACEVLALVASQPEMRPTDWLGQPNSELSRRFIALEDGDLTDALRAPGLLAGDVFGWYAPLLDGDPPLTQGLRNVILAISELAWARVANAGSVAVDLLRHLYQEIVPRKVRKALGEFFTPRWVAERMLVQALELAGELDAPRILDPACGSGTFLVAAFARELARLEASGSDSPDAIGALSHRIIGFDINPVSALMSRVNLLLVLGDRAQKLPTIGFSVFQTDSILLPDVVRGVEQLDLFDVPSDVIIIPTSVGTFSLPAALSTLDGAAILRRSTELGIANGRAPALFGTRLRAELAGVVDEDRQDETVAIATAFYSKVRALDEEGRNGVWARIVEQALAPVFLHDVDLVIGNPPWISWKDLPSGWKERSEPTWRRWGLWPERRGRRGGGVPLSDISTLLLARSVSTYAPNGLVAFLLPKSILIADPGGRPIRRCDLSPSQAPVEEPEETEASTSRFSPIAVDDFSVLNPFSPDASTLPIALYVRAHEAPEFPFPQTRWQRSSPGSRLSASASWSATEKQLAPVQFDAEPIDPTDPGSPWAKTNSPTGLQLLRHGMERDYEWGRGFETRGADGIFFCEVITPEPVGPMRLVRIRSRPDLGDNTRRDRVREGEVEADMLWPLVKGENVRRWFVTDSGLHCIVPHKPEEPEQVYTVDEVSGGVAPHLFDYLEPVLGTLRKRSMYRGEADAKRPWALSGPTNHLDGNDSVVAVRYIAGGGLPAAAVLAPRFRAQLGRVTVDLPNNKSNVIFTSSEDEAFYLAAWINSAPAQEQIARFAASTGITPRVLEYLPIARFDPALEQHARLAVLARAATKAATGSGEQLSELEAEIGDVVRKVARSA